MSLYKYKVADRSGKTFDTLIEGESPEDSLKRLKSRGLIRIEFYGEANQLKSRVGKGIFKKKSNFDVYRFTNRLVPLLNANIQLEKSLRIISEGTESGTQRDVVNSIRTGLHEGKKFSELIRLNNMYFPDIYANLAEAGEVTGALKHVMAELQYFMNYRKEMKDFLVTSSIYPIIILVVTFGVLILLFTVFLPRFSTIFINMGKPLPLPTKILLEISHIIAGLWWLWITIIAGIVYFVSRVKKGGKAKTWVHSHVLKFPVLGKIIHISEACMFIKTLAVLIKNDVHLLTAVTISCKVVQNRKIFSSLNNVNNELKGGKKLSVALSGSPFIPKIAIQMLEIGEESGHMGEMLKQVSEELENELKLKIKRLLGLFEPMVILFLALAVVIVVISIFMAIMEMNNI